MKINFSLSDDELIHFSEPAINELISGVDEYLNILVRQAITFEKMGHLGSGDPEITADNVIDAKREIKRRSSNNKQKWWSIPIKLISAVSTFVTGLMFDIDYIRANPNQIIIIIVLGAIALATNFILIFSGRNSEPK
jgi:hypothetical protein